MAKVLFSGLFLMLCSFKVFAQPANNTYATATDITSIINSCSADAAYTTIAATADGSAGSCWSNGPNYNVWFKFTATSTQYIKVQLKVGGSEGTMQNPFVALWATNGTTQLNCQNYQGATVDIETDYYGLTAGSVYYISVDNYSGAGYKGTFKLCLSDVPDYNFYEGATDVTSLINTCSANAAYTTINASNDKNAGSCWSNGPNYNRWFKFTATSTQYIKVQLKVGGVEGTMQNPFVALWASNGTTQLNCQNYQGATTDIETDYYGLTAGQTYYISVDNYSGAGYRGTFTLCLSDVVDYNFYEGATDVTSLINTCSANAAYTTINASADKNAGSCWSNGPNYNRWFKFTATSTQYMKVQLKVGGVEGTMQNPFVALWASNGTTQLNCQNYQGATTDIETDYYGLTAGQTYYISVDNYSGAGYRGTFTLCLSDVVDYNFYEGATDVTSLINTCSANAAYTTTNASADKSAGSCWSNGPNYNRWFKFTATSTQYMKVQLKVGGVEGTMQNPFVALWASNGTTQLNCQNYQGATTDIETDYYGLTAGQTYYISVDNYSGSGYQGTFTLCLSDVVDYNFYEGATDVTSLINTCSANAAYTTINASSDKNAGSCWSNGPNYNRWFKFTATSTQYMKVQLKVGGVEGTMQNPFVALWASNGTTQLNCQNYQGATTDIETDYYGLTAGQTYYISVDNYSGAGYRGTFTLCLSDVIDYNFYEGATDVTNLINTCSANAAYTTINASSDKNAGSCWSNGPNYNRWFKFTATSTQYMKVQLKVGGVEGTMQNPFVALWASNGTTQLNCQNYQGASTDIETDYYGLTAGQTYYISVDNYSGAGYRGTFTLCLSDVVDYNFYEGATDVTSLINGCSANAAYTTINASADKNAGSCWSNGPNYNRWFKFTATSTQYMKVQLKVGGVEGTMQNPFVALWASNGTTQLNCQNYQGASTDIETDYYGLTAGQTYYISVDNYSGAGYRGTFTLCLSDVLDYNYYEGATNLTNLNNWCSANAAYSTTNATADKNKGTCWSNGPNYNRWFKFTALYTSATIQVKVGGVEGTMQNPFVALWSSNGTSQLACTNYAGASVDITLVYALLTPGQTYYISVDNYSGAGYRGTFTLCVNNVDPTIFYSRANTNWATNTTWSNVGYGGVVAATVPSSGSLVYIQDNTVTVNSTGQCAELNISTSGSNTALTVDNATLTINGKYIQSNSSNNTCITTIQNNGIVNVADDATITRTGGNKDTQINMTSGTLNVGQDMIWTSSSGTSKDNTMTLTNAAAVNITRDLTLSSSGGRLISLNFSNTSTLSVGRDLTFTATAAGQEEIIFNNTAGLSIKRDIVRGGTPYGMLTFNGTSSITFNGTLNQQVMAASAGSGGDAITYKNMIINNSSGYTPDITMGGVATLNGNLTMTNGIVQTTSSNYLSLLSASSTTIGNSNSYIDGPMNYELASSTANTVRNFPIGKSNFYRPAVLTLTHSDATSVTYTAEVMYTSAQALGYTLSGTIDKVSPVRYWQIDRTAVANLTTAAVQLYYGSDDIVSDYTNLTVVKTIGAGTTWFDIGGTATANGSGSITSGAFTSFSRFTFGNKTGAINLPITLVDFQAKPKGSIVELSWATESEVNNNYFTVEKTKGNGEFEIVSTVKGAGNSTQLLNYSTIDTKPYKGKSYYRLKQTDFDGKYACSEMLAVEFNEKYVFDVYPNPTVNSNVNVNISGSKDEQVLIVVRDMLGREFYSKVHILKSDNSSFQIDDISHLTPGMYAIVASSGNTPINSRVIVIE